MTETGNHGHGHTIIGDALGDIEGFAGRAEQLLHRHQDDAAETPGANPYFTPAPSQTPAQQPVTVDTAPTAKEPDMSLSKLEDAVKNDLGEGLDFLEGFVGRLKAAAPNIIETTEAVGGSTVGKLAETLAGALIPEPFEGMLVNLVKDFAGRYGQPAQPAAPAPADPAQTAA